PTGSATTAHATLSLHDALPIFAEADIVPGAGDIGAIDEVVDVLVEQEGRYRAGAAHIVLDAEVEVGRLQRLQVGIAELRLITVQDRKSTRLNSSHVKISYAVFC